MGPLPATYPSVALGVALFSPGVRQAWPSSIWDCQGDRIRGVYECLARGCCLVTPPQGRLRPRGTLSQCGQQQLSQSTRGGDEGMQRGPHGHSVWCPHHLDTMAIRLAVFLSQG